MNAASPSPHAGSRPAAAPSPAEAPARTTPRPLQACEQRQRGDEFERVLRQKSAPSRDDEPGSDTADHEDEPPGLAALLPWCPAPALQAAKAAAAPGAPAAADPSPNATQAAVGTALSADAGPLPAAGLRTDTASAWQVTLNDPRGVAVELRATRPAALAGADRPANWALTIAAPAHDAALLARHVPRLNERLRARELTHTHVRIEDDDEQSS